MCRPAYEQMVKKHVPALFSGYMFVARKHQPAGCIGLDGRHMLATNLFTWHMLVLRRVNSLASPDVHHSLQAAVSGAA
jgi:hypothetical protein